MTSARRLRILFVAYPLLPVSEASAGGAEQVLWTLERELSARGHLTTVAACSGSQVAGTLLETGDPPEAPDAFPQREQEHVERIVNFLKEGFLKEGFLKEGVLKERGSPCLGFDLIHDHSGSLWREAARISLPVLATLHLPRSFYKREYFEGISGNVFFNGVSRCQLDSFPDLPKNMGEVANGIAVERFSPAEQDPCSSSPREKDSYLLWLGRICEEKGTHVALDVAYAARKRILIAGQVYPFLYHQKYFAREIIPRLKRAGDRAKFLSSPSFAEKVNLLQGAEALLIPSLADETSSLVAMEAAASGVPVVAFRRGALPEIIAEGKTGFVVGDTGEMLSALAETSKIDPAECVRFARERYSAEGMADRYEALYSKVLEKR